MSILKIAISSRALFDLNESHKVFKEKGIEKYSKFQKKNMKMIFLKKVLPSH